ncbi:MAG TPA: Lrp/AsnC family transcriptional regulator [Jatrophihabitans sp.]|nr:Lrp/AsnC family transcriptional regulator [Jatrophihabitans sp.]
MTVGTDPVLDELDRRIVVELQSDGRSSWTEIAERAGTTVPTVARRAQNLFQRRILRVGVVADIHHAGPAELFLLRIRCNPGQQLAVAEQLATLPSIRFLAITAGGSDLVAEMVCRRDEIPSLRLITDVQLIKGVLSCESDMVLHTYKVAHDWSRALLAGQVQTAPSQVVHECDPSHFDKLGLQIVEAMRVDGRASFTSVAETLGANESTVRRRFEAMAEQGCIQVVTIVAAAALGFEFETLVQIEVAPAQIGAVAQELSDYVGVRYLAGTLGSSSLFAELILPTTADMHRFLTDQLAHLEGVRGWQAYTELITLKRGFVETPWWRDRIEPAGSGRRRR